TRKDGDSGGGPEVRHRCEMLALIGGKVLDIRKDEIPSISEDGLLGTKKAADESKERT
ncbi:MAG: hypothetical protein Q9224_007520, partial [Gallowayella concinna]